MDHTHIPAAASASLYGGAAGGIVGWALSINWLGLIGATVAVGGFIASLYFQLRRDQREAKAHRALMREHEANMRKLDPNWQPSKPGGGSGF